MGMVRTGRYTTIMRRLLSGAIAGLVLAVALAVVAAAPAAAPRHALADDPTPVGGGPTEVDINPDPMAEPAFAYMAALLAGSAVLFVVGFVAMRMNKPKRRRRKPGTDWWECRACGVKNAPERSACFACRAARSPGVGGTAPGGPPPVA